MTIRISAFGALSLCATLTAFTATDALAQAKCKVNSEVAAATSKYTQQHVLDARDIPGHQIRIFELHRTFPDAKPNCEGLKPVESWATGFSDYVDRNGHAWGYAVTMLENGDKIFTEFDGTSQTVVGPDGSNRSTYTGITKYTGGTGRYQAVRGLTRETVIFDPEKNMNQAKSEGEYWFEGPSVAAAPTTGSYGSTTPNK